MTQSGTQPPLVRIVPAGSPARMKADAVVRDQTGGNATIPHRTTAQIAKDIGLFIAAPFVTLVYVSLFPFIGVAMVVRAWGNRKEAV